MRSGAPHSGLAAIALGAALALAASAAPQNAKTPAAAEPSADELLFRFRDAYAGLAGYHDTGEIERTEGDKVTRIRFRTDLESDGELRFSYMPERGEPASIAAKAGGEAAAVASARSLAGSLDGALGNGAAAALPVPVLLAAGALAVPEPEALTLDGVEPCGEGRCVVLAGAHPAEGVSFRLFLGEADHLLRRSEVELVRGAERRSFRVTLRPVVEPRVQEQVFSETVTVSLSSIVARVIDRTGAAVTDLTAADFRLRLGREELVIQDVEWVSESAPAAGQLAAEKDAEATPEPDDWVDEAPGRLVVFFVQASLEATRVGGQMRMRQHVRRFIDDLPAGDRVAVVSFDSHLKLRADFTADRSSLDESLDAAWKTGPEPRLGRSAEPSLARHFDRTAATRAASPERGLEVLARALEPLPGEKLVVYLGFGFGHYSSTGVTMLPAYDDALRALAAARATVFALDVTDAASHSLEVGMRQVARDTGGTYMKTHEFPALATKRLEEAISGHYVLYFELPERERPRAKELRVDLRDPGRGEVLVRETTIR